MENRRWNKEVIKKNEALEPEDQTAMEIQKGKLTIDGKVFQKEIPPPQATEILTLLTQELQKIMKIPICKGPEITMEENKFRAYSLPVKDLSQIQEAYLKMRICQPTSRHIMCAYYLPGSPHFIKQGYCDDGEHAAGEKILSLLVENMVTNRVIFVTRQFSGIKIGGSRFDCILDAVKKCIELYPSNDVIGGDQQIRDTENDMDEQTDVQGPGRDNGKPLQVDGKQLQSKPQRKRNPYNGRGRGGRRNDWSHTRHPKEYKRRASTSPNYNYDVNYPPINSPPFHRAESNKYRRIDFEHQYSRNPAYRY